MGLRKRADVELDEKLQSKVCRVCGDRKPFSSFNKSGWKDHLKGICEECRVATSKSTVSKRTENQIKRDIESQTKYCSKCLKSKSFSEFDRSKRSKDGVGYACKSCREIERLLRYKPEVNPRRGRNNNYKKCYNISIEDYDILYKKQEGVCACCGLPPKDSDKSKHLFVDHCHDTGVIRGLLCRGCNSGIGILGDSIESLKRALIYLEGTDTL